jgi:hypothetical protein
MAPSMSRGHSSPRPGAAPLGDGDSQRLVERFRRRAHAEPRETRDEVKKADDVERIHAAACLVVPDRRCPDRLRIAEPIGDAADKSVERNAAHLALDLPDAAVGAALETLDESGSDARHRRAKSGSHFPTKHRGEQTPLSVPVLTVHRDEPARHARSQNATLDRAFATGRLIFDENLTDGGGIADHRDPCKRKPAEHDLFFEMRPLVQHSSGLVRKVFNNANGPSSRGCGIGAGGRKPAR